MLGLLKPLSALPEEQKAATVSKRKQKSGLAGTDIAAAGGVNDRAFGTAEAAYEKSMEADLYG
jgi:hypothetical protein